MKIRKKHPVYTVLSAILLALTALVVSAVTGSSENPVIVAEAATVSTPTLSSVTNTSSGVKVKWGKVSGATGYYVYRSTSKSGTYKKIATVTSGSTMTYTNKNSGTNKVSAGKTYYYKVAAYKGSSVSSRSSAKKMIYLTAGKISSLTNTVKGVKVQWSSVTGATGYYVYRKVSGGSFSKIATTDDTSYIDARASTGTTYYYAVRPYKGSYKGSYTSSSITVKAVLTTLSISSLTNSTCSTAVVKWGKTSSSVDGYQVQYSYSNSFTDPTTVTVKGASTVSTEITGLTRSKTVYVRVRAYQTVSGTKYYSSWSSSKNVKITGAHDYKTTTKISGTSLITTETCSLCSDSYSDTTPIVGDVDNVTSTENTTIGHWETVIVEEAWDETVKVYSDTSYLVCNACGAYYDTVTEVGDHIFEAHDGAATYTAKKVIIETYIVHHDAVTEQVWVED